MAWKSGNRIFTTEEMEELADEGFVQEREDGTEVVVNDLRDDPEFAEPVEWIHDGHLWAYVMGQG